MNEHDIQNICLDWLNQHGIFAWRNQSQGTYDPIRKMFRKKVGFDIKGVSDIIGILPTGRFLAVEVKAPDETESALTMEQKAFIAKITQIGGLAVWVNSLERLQEIMKENGYGLGNA